LEGDQEVHPAGGTSKRTALLGMRLLGGARTRSYQDYQIEDYAARVIDHFNSIAPDVALKKVTTPFLSPEPEKTEFPRAASWEEMVNQVKTPIETQKGRFAQHAPSVLMKALWLARVGRPDLSLVISRLARRVNSGANEKTGS
jgi:hypothetical protein